MKNRLNVVASLGLAAGGIFGLAGTFVSSRPLQAAFWAFDGTAVVIAAALLSLKFLRKENDWVAAGFLIYAIGEAIMLPGTATSLTDSVPSFAAGIALWSAGLVLVSAPRGFALWARITGIIAAVLFAITSAKMFWGQPLLPTSAPLPSLGYPFLVLTFIGWIWTLLRPD
ncbi:MAG TPA: hypothetical protein VHX37_16480 [Acidobacteriaceae bacterium]|jgi:hypothetical protein|nr:hypothetical protein [Acidobacteriaceae bacterium]